MTQTPRTAAARRRRSSAGGGALLLLVVAAVALLVMSVSGCGSGPLSVSAGGVNVTIGKDGNNASLAIQPDAARLTVRPGATIRGTVWLDASGHGQVAAVAGHLTRLSRLHGNHRKLPASWVKFGPPVDVPVSAFTHLPFTVTVPPGTRPGRYQSDIVATPNSAGSGNSKSKQVDVGLGTQVATLIVVTVP